MRSEPQNVVTGFPENRNYKGERIKECSYVFPLLCSVFHLRTLRFSIFYLSPLSSLALLRNKNPVATAPGSDLVLRIIYP